MEIGVFDQVEKAFFDDVMAFEMVSLEAMDTVDLISPDAGLKTFKFSSSKDTKFPSIKCLM